MTEAGRLSTLEFVNPQLSAGWAHQTVPASAARPLPVAEPAQLPDVEIDWVGRVLGLPEFHELTASTSLLVLAGGTLVREWYPPGRGPTDLFLGASASKSVLAHLVGRAVRAGSLGLDDRVREHLPELAGTGYAVVTVRQLLSMTSGVDWVEDHRDPAGPASALAAAFAEGASSRAVLSRVGPRISPGTRYEYCTADSQVLDWVRERAIGVPFAPALTRLWRDLGCTADAAVAVDGEGVALAGGGLAATARDWARIGLLQVDGLAPDGTRLLDPDWVTESSRPARPFLRPGRLPSTLSTHVGFGYHWWPLDSHGDRVAADGSRGQFVYLDRPRRVVVVKTSNWAFADPLADRQRRDLSYLALPAIAASAGSESLVEEVQQ